MLRALPFVFNLAPRDRRRRSGQERVPAVRGRQPLAPRRVAAFVACAVRALVRSRRFHVGTGTHNSAHLRCRIYDCRLNPSCTSQIDQSLALAGESIYEG
jgi:hypothetical protein